MERRTGVLLSGHNVPVLRRVCTQEVWPEDAILAVEDRSLDATQVLLQRVFKDPRFASIRCC